MHSAWRVVAVIAASIVVAAAGSATGYAAAAGGGSARVAAEATSVPARVLDAVGAGSIPRSSVGGRAGVLRSVTGKLLTRGGKPELLYIGADYCPFCASEQWPIVVALSRFGRFSGLSESRSSASDVYPDTATLRFYRARYTSRYLRFTAVDLFSRTQAPLQRLTAAEQTLMTRYDRLQAIPFVDIGNRYAQVGAIFSPRVLAAQTWWYIAVALHRRSSAIAQAVDGAANYLTAAICALTGNRPATACTPVIRTLEHNLRPSG
jgi:hypothetical protein